jgi:hypothetical protein
MGFQGIQKDAMATDLPRLKRELKLIADDKAPPTENSLDITGATTLSDVVIRAWEYFDSHPAEDAVTLVYGPEALCVVTRDSLGPREATAADLAPANDVGVGERGTLPGTSTRYKLWKFSCGKCQWEMYCIHFDARDLPTCQHHPCKMEYRHEA